MTDLGDRSEWAYDWIFAVRGGNVSARIGLGWEIDIWEEKEEKSNAFVSPHTTMGLVIPSRLLCI